MTHLHVPGQAIRRTIRMDSRLGNQLDNAQSFEVTAPDLAADKGHRDKFKNAKFCTGVSPVYNCHGLTFGARRTRIYDVETLRQILKEDDYQGVDRLDVQVGDVILYVSPEDGDIDHSGIVVEVLRPTGFTTPMPRILSKWGGGAEVVHMFNECPYSESRIEFFRICR